MSTRLSTRTIGAQARVWASFALGALREGMRRSHKLLVELVDSATDGSTALHSNSGSFASKESMWQILAVTTGLFPPFLCDAPASSIDRPIPPNGTDGNTETLMALPVQLSCSLSDVLTRLVFIDAARSQMLLHEALQASLSASGIRVGTGRVGMQPNSKTGARARKASSPRSLEFMQEELNGSIGDLLLKYPCLDTCLSMDSEPMALMVAIRGNTTCAECLGTISRKASATPSQSSIVAAVGGLQLVVASLHESADSKGWQQSYSLPVWVRSSLNSTLARVKAVLSRPTKDYAAGLTSYYASIPP